MKYGHGDAIVDIQGQIVSVTLIGSFDEFGVRKYAEELKQQVMSLQGQEFAVLVNVIAFTGGTPEAYEEIELYNQWLNQENMVAKAMVSISQLTLSIALPRTPARSVQNMENFSDSASAREWLEHQLAQVKV